MQLRSERKPRSAGTAIRQGGLAARTWLIGAVVISVAAFALAACGEESDSQPAASAAPSSSSAGLTSSSSAGGVGITVSGTGVVSTVPDQARFFFGVRSDRATAEAALAETSAATAALIDALKQAGIDEADLQTQQVSVVPLYRDDVRSVSGYMASNSVSTLIRDLDSAGEIVDVAVAAGANEVFGPSLDVSDLDALTEQALTLAVERARVRALALAEAAGVELGQILAIAEAGSTVPFFGATAEAAVEADFAPIEPGTRDIQASVTVTFAIG